MLNKIEKVVARYEDLERQMSDPAVLADHVRLTELAQERSDMASLVEAYKKYQKSNQELTEARELVDHEDDPEMIAMANEEVNRLTAELEMLEKSMRSLLVPKDPRDDKSVFIEIRAGAGGDEAGIFACGPAAHVHALCGGTQLEDSDHEREQHGRRRL